MRHLKQSLNESLGTKTINEKFVSDEMGKLANSDLEGVLNQMSAWADKFELVTPAKIKKIFPGSSKDQLEDYCTIIAHMGEQISSIIQLCREHGMEDEEEALTYLEYAFNIKDRVENAAENILSDEDLKSVENDEDVYNMTQEVAEKWNIISKVMIGQDWYNPRNY